MIGVNVRGDKELADLLAQIAPRNALNITRNTVHGVASELAKEIREDAPVDDGVMKKNIKAKRERVNWGVARSTVQAAADAFYWRFHERGTSKEPARPFILPKIEALRPRMPQIWREQFGKKFEAALARARKRMGG